MTPLPHILAHLHLKQDEDRKVAHLEPDVDQRDLPSGAKLREEETLQHGGVLKAIIQQGEGDETPHNGDIIFIQYTIMNASGEVVESTQQQHGGPGHPRPFLLTAGNARPLRGIELAVLQMRQGEMAKLEIQPEMAYLHPDSKISPPLGVRRDDVISVDVLLTSWIPGSASASNGYDNGLIMQTKIDGTGWETPRQPFDVHVTLKARKMSTDGRLHQGALLYGPIEVSCSLGSGTIPPGIEAAVSSMRRGEESVIWCPIKLANPTFAPPVSSVSPPIPTITALPCAFSSLEYIEYTVTLIEFTQVRDLMGDGAVTKRILRKGEGEFPADCPLEDAQVSVKLRARQAPDGVWQPLRVPQGPGVVFSTAEKSEEIVRVETGMGAIPGPIDAAIRVMLPEEVALVTSDWSHAFPENHAMRYELDIAPGSNVEFEIQLIHFEPEPHWASQTVEDKIARSVRWKEQGNELFKAKRFILAKMKYMKGLKCLDRSLDVETEDQVLAAGAAKVACFLNLAACAQRLNEWGEAVDWCDKAISEDPDHAKAYFRRAVSRHWLGRYDEAMEDFSTAKRLDPAAADDIDKELARLSARVKAAAQKQRNEMRNFFDRLEQSRQ